MTHGLVLISLRDEAVISLLKEQAIAYGMEPKDIGLNVDPDRELI